MKLRKTGLTITTTEGSRSYRLSYHNDTKTKFATVDIKAGSRHEAKAKLQAMANDQKINIFIGQ